MSLVLSQSERSTSPAHQDALIGDSPAIHAINRLVAAAAQTSANVLITGERGTGKEVVARLIHKTSEWTPGRFATVSCAGLPDVLLERELFGRVGRHVSDGHHDRPGLFEAASRGTVFLDDIGEMSTRLQTVLFRFLETGGAPQNDDLAARHSLDVRIIAATNRDLLQPSSFGHFREDLFYRLNVIRVDVPPLRARREDIPVLLDHCIRLQSREYRVAPCVIAPETNDLLATYSWPGNIRELKTVTERLVVTKAGAIVSPVDLPAEILESLADTRSPIRHGAPATFFSSLPATLVAQMVERGESFWSIVYPHFVSREISQAELRSIVQMGLEMSRGNYHAVVRLFNMAPGDYPRFLGFLAAQGCALASGDSGLPPHILPSRVAVRAAAHR